MEIVLVGADIEENLGIGMIAAAARKKGAQVRVMSLDEGGGIADVARRITARRPGLVGLSIPFQQRARHLLQLAEALRSLGYSGHITAGGFFATLAWEQLLQSTPEVDSVVLHEGEETIVELVSALERAEPLERVRGVAHRDGDRLCHNEGRPLAQDLDALPFAARSRRPATHLGVPFIPMVGSRGCWGACSFCSIASFTDSAARAPGARQRVRLRSRKDIAAEMAGLWHEAGGQAVFCFHDANFLLPRPAATLRRLRTIRDLLAEQGVDRFALVGNARPDCITADLTPQLRELGVLWLYVGVENASAAGAQHLNRQMPLDRVDQALDACRRAGIFACYNLLMFEPRTTMEDLQQNVAFIRRHAASPMSFRRAEPYVGTPIYRELAARGRLTGDYLGHGYAFDDPRVDMAHRICAEVFAFRNYTKGGVHNRAMRLGYRTNMLAHFYPDQRRRHRELAASAEQLMKDISLDTADALRLALELARDLAPGDPGGMRRHTETLAARVEPADQQLSRRLDQLCDAIDEACAASASAPFRAPVGTWQRARRAAVKVAQGVAVVSLLATPLVTGSGCSDDDTSNKDAGVDHGLLDDAAPPPDMHDMARPDYSLLDDAAPPPKDMPDFSVVDDASPPDYSMLDDAAPPPDMKKPD